MGKIKVCILRTAGTNCDKETGFAFSRLGASVHLVHIGSLIKGSVILDDYHILAIPGGFTYGDDVAAGKILANEMKYKLDEALRKFIAAGKLIIGICNGFQVLVKSGLLPGNAELRQETSLILNDSAKFEDRWIYLKLSVTRPTFGGYPELPVRCVWAKDLPEIIYLPVAHGEGKFVAENQVALERLKKNRQIVFQYCNELGTLAGYPHNPNGSAENIAGICDETGRIFGLMPHPERHMDFFQHPRWTGLKIKKEGDGLQIFRNGVEYAKKNL